MTLHCCDCGAELRVFSDIATEVRKRERVVKCRDLDACRANRERRERERRDPFRGREKGAA